MGALTTVAGAEDSTTVAMTGVVAATEGVAEVAETSIAVGVEVHLRGNNVCARARAFPREFEEEQARVLLFWRALFSYRGATAFFSAHTSQAYTCSLSVSPSEA